MRNARRRPATFHSLGHFPDPLASSYLARLGHLRPCRMAQRLRLPPPLLFPSTTSRPLRLAAQINYDPSNPANPPYVLHAVSHRGGYLFAASDDTIRAFSPNLQPLGQLPVSQRGITSMVKGAGEDSNAVFVTAKDGTVSCWDLRDLTKEAFKLKGAFPLCCALL